VNGFIIQGVSESGVCVSNGGDINGDGRTDLLVGAYGANEAYVIFGQNSTTPFTSPFNAPTSLNGVNGFIIQGVSESGVCVSNGGDINGDGRTDLLVGEPNENEVYVIFGQDSTTPFTSPFNAPTSLNGANGFIIQGGGSTGFSVSNGGDINGDGRTDLLVGAQTANEAYVIFGQDSTTPFTSPFNAPTSLNGANGFIIKGGSQTGTSVSNGGDINGDGITDLLVGAYGANRAYVIFGGPPACLSPSPSDSPSSSASISPSASISSSPSPSFSQSPSSSISPSGSVSPSPSKSPSKGFGGDSASMGALTGLSSQIASMGLVAGSNAGLLTNTSNGLVSSGQQASFMPINSDMIAYNSQPLNQFSTITNGLDTSTGIRGTSITGLNTETAGGGTSNIGTTNTGTTTITGATGTTGTINGAQTIVCQEILSTPSASPSTTFISPIKTLKSKKQKPAKAPKGKQLQARAISERKADKPNVVKIVLKEGQVLSTTGEVIPKGLVGKVVQKVNKKGSTKFKVKLIKKDPVTGQKTPAQQFQCSQTIGGQPSSSPAPSSTTPVCRKIIQIKKYDAATRKYKLIKTKEVEGGSITIDPKGKNVIKSKNLKSGGLRVLIQKKNGKRKIIKDFACRRVVKKNPPIKKGKVKRFDLNLLKERTVEGPDSRRNIRGTDSSMASTPESLWMKPFSLAADALGVSRQSFLGGTNIEQVSTNENRWNAGSLVNPAQLPLAQTGMHLMQQGYNRILDWFQGRGSDEDIQIQELLPREQVAGFLQEYTKVSQELEGIIQQLEVDDSVAGNVLGWLKDSIVEHRAQGQRLMNQQRVAQENIKTYFENLQVVTKDVTELIEDLAKTTNSFVLPYIQSRLAGVNQEIASLSSNPLVITKDQATLVANVKAQLQSNALQQQAMNLVPQTATYTTTPVTADVIGLLV
jgi:hypothetical protein